MTDILEKAVGRYGVLPLIKAIQGASRKLSREDDLRDFLIALDALEERQTFSDGTVSVPRETLVNLILLACDQAFSDKLSGKKSRAAHSGLTSRERETLSNDIRRGLAVVAQLPICKSKNEAFDAAAQEIGCDRSTIIRSLKRLFPEEPSDGQAS